jgi:hypothetical protein
MVEKYGVTGIEGIAQKEGAKRLSALLMTSIGVGMAVAKFNETIGGFNQEQVEALKETVLPDWEKNKLLGIRRDDKGNIRYTNISYILPVASVTGIVQSVLEGKSLEEAMGNMLESVWDEVGGEGTFVAQNMFAAIMNFDPQTKRAISNDPRLFESTMEKFGFVWNKSFTLGQWREIQKALKNPADQTLLRHSGWREHDTTLEKGVSFKMRDLSKGFREVSSALEGARIRGDMGSFNKLTQTHAALAQQTAKHIQNLRTLGMDEDHIVDLISSGGVSKSLVFSLLDDNYQPPSFNKPTTKADLFEQYSSTDEDRKLAVLKSFPPDVQQYINTRIKTEAKRVDWSERDKYIASLGVVDGERAQHVMQMLAKEEKPDVKLKELYRKGVLNDTVLKQIQQLKLTPPQ